MVAHAPSVAAIAFLACAAQPPQEAPQASTPQSVQSGRETALARSDPPKQPIRSVISPPPGYERIVVQSTSFGAWLRELPVREGRPPVYLYDGREKANQAAHHAVLDVDVGSKDLQQCADAVIRLWAEFLYSGFCWDSIQFDFTSGDTARWMDWRKGLRPVVSENSVSWRQTGDVDGGYSNFREYLETVFLYAGSASLEKELVSVADSASPDIGDVFIEGGFPGHAVLVVDVAENDDGERVFLLAQSYMPAQDIHILRSFEDITPWYQAHSQGVLQTPEWEFTFGDLKRFPFYGCDVN